MFRSIFSSLSFRTSKRIPSIHDGPPRRHSIDLSASNPPKVSSDTASGSTIEEPLQACIERLGRERPPIFTSTWSESLFVFSISMSQFMTEFMVSGFTLLLPSVIQELGIPSESIVWPSTAFSLAIAATLLVFGRLGDIWGGYPFFLGGLLWLLIWSIVTGFSPDSITLNVCRALQGLGSAACLPTGVMLLGNIYRPGPRKNIVFAIYGTSGIIGFFVGIFFAGVVGQYVRWGWYFWIGGILVAITLLASFFSIPKPSPRNKSSSLGVEMDYLGTLTIICGLTLTVFAITQSAHAPSGWKTPYIPVCLALGLLSLCCAFYVEAYVARQPLLPAFIFKTPSMTPLLLALFLLYGTWSIFSVYGTLYFQNIMHASPIQIVAWYVPLGIAGLLFSALEGSVLHLIPGRFWLIVSGLAALGSQLLLALIPLGGSYWAYIMPAMIFATAGIDLSTILMTVFVTNTIPSSQQGVAGGVINSVLQLGMAVFLGLTDILQSATVEEAGLRQSYKNTFWFGVGAGALSLILMAVFGKVPKATSDLTVDEKAELSQETQAEDSAPEEDVSAPKEGTCSV